MAIIATGIFPCQRLLGETLKAISVEQGGAAKQRGGTTVSGSGHLTFESLALFRRLRRARGGNHSGRPQLHQLAAHHSDRRVEL